MNPLSLLQHPDVVGQSEYRAIYDCIYDALLDTPDEVKKEMVLGMLEEFESWAKVIKNTILYNA
jgi:hypothetical protein